MPGSIVQASPGGTSPRTINHNQILNSDYIEDEIESVRCLAEEDGDTKEDGGGRDAKKDEATPRVGEEEGAQWIQGATSEDNERYRVFLAYMEEKREEARMRIQEDEDRKREAKSKEDSWQLMKEAVSFLRTNADKWRERRIEECERIRKEEKEDRLWKKRGRKREMPGRQ